mmetsp:Transcript_16147/g.41790  ORF Transcript_16147/g.41790 Transcript_16147/m.41790 type:complete len:581 (+) Transcript_16147:94-1836(+)
MGRTAEDEENERWREERRFQDACSDDEDQEPGAPQLPWGVKKKLLKAAPAASDDLRPEYGDEVSIHFVAKLLNGTQIGSSREGEDARPFKFFIGQEPREIVLGLELGVTTMRKGEEARFRVAPRFAYDDLGAPPLVPPDAALIFDVELLDWETKDDLYCDGRAVKTVLTRGTGKEKPVRGQDVMLSLHVSDRRNKVIEEHATFEHTVCAQDFGPMSRIVASAVQTMVEGERSSVKLSWDACAERKYSEATLELALARVFEREDASPAQDGSLIKKVLRRGTGDSCPRDASLVCLLVTSATGGDGAVLPGFKGPQRLDFCAGDGEVCDALEFAVLKMKAGEEAVLTCVPPMGYREPRLGLAGDETCAVLTVELTSMEESADPAGLHLEQRLAFAAARKGVATKLFGQQRFALALARYDGILALVEPSSGSEVEELRRACQLNRAACLLKLAKPQDAKAACEKVLKLDPDNIKARYRRASANFALSDYESAKSDVSLVLGQDPRNAEARDLSTKIKEAQKQYAQQAKSTAARMVQQEQQTSGAGEAAKGSTEAAAAATPSAVSRYLPACLAAPCAYLCAPRR